MPRLPAAIEQGHSCAAHVRAYMNMRRCVRPSVRDEPAVYGDHGQGNGQGNGQAWRLLPALGVAAGSSYYARSGLWLTMVEWRAGAVMQGRTSCWERRGCCSAWRCERGADGARGESADGRFRL